MILIFKALNGLIDWDFYFRSFNDIHGYNTRTKDNICKPLSRRPWEQKRFIYDVVSKWNTLPAEVKNITSILILKVELEVFFNF